MSRLTNWLPSGALDRVRLGTLCTSAINGLLLFSIVGKDLPPLHRAIAFAAIVVAQADGLLTYLRGRLLWWEPLAIVPLLLGFGSYASSLSGFIGFGVGVALTQSLYGSGRSVLVRAVGTATATVIAISIPADVVGRVANTDRTPIAVVLIAPAIFAGFMYLIGVTLRLLEQAGQREELLARVGMQLTGLTEVPAAHAVLHEAGRDLCALMPGLAMVVTRCVAGQRSIVAIHGLPDAAVGRVLSLPSLDGLDLQDNTPRRLGQTAALDALLGRRRSGWTCFGFNTDDVEWYILVSASTRQVPGIVLDAVRTFTAQGALAQATCRAHAELIQLANHDQLTNTPNRRAFFALLAAAVDDSQLADAGQIALLIIDLDDFKQVNDTLGHQAGDELLIAIADRLASVVGVADGDGVASRFGGDEFAVLLHSLSSQSEADEIAWRVCQRLQEPVRLSTGTVTVGGSVGLVGGGRGTTAGDLMRCADIAMYSAKAGGKNRVERFTEEQHGKAAHLRLLEDHLPQIVARDEIVVHYQPQIDLRTGRCVAVEAVAWWRHPTLGMLPTSEFMHLAERHGITGDLSVHIMRLACRQLKAWIDERAVPELRISVNLSSRLLVAPGLAELVGAVLAETGVPAAQLALEFSESEVLDQESARAHLAAIASMGVRIALDDVGTRNVSLANLHILQLNQLEVDCRLFGELGGSAATERINLIMSVSRFLGLETVGKTIESQDQAAWARRVGLTLGQGSQLCPPMPADDATHWLGADTGSAVSLQRKCHTLVRPLGQSGRRRWSSRPSSR